MPYMITGARNLKRLINPKTARACPECGRYTHIWEDRGDIKTKINRDWSGTQESFQIVSQRFKDTVEANSPSDIDFFPLSNGMYVFRPREAVFLDLIGAVRGIYGPCLVCGRFTGFMGVGCYARIMEGQREIGPFDIVRSAQAFGGDQSVYEMSIFGDEITAVMKAAKFRGSVSWDHFPQDPYIPFPFVEFFPPSNIKGS